jgi:hypothetical protein
VQSEAVLTWTVLQSPAVHDEIAQNDDRRERASADDRRDFDEDRRERRRHDDDEDRDDDDRGREGRYIFSEHDRRIIGACLGDSRSNLPPGLAKKDRLPPGLERQVQRNGTLPPGLQKRVRPLPYECEVRLPRLPRDWERVVLGARVILLDPGRRVIDLFEFSREDD